ELDSSVLQRGDVECQRGQHDAVGTTTVGSVSRGLVDKPRIRRKQPGRRRTGEQSDVSRGSWRELFNRTRYFARRDWNFSARTDSHKCRRKRKFCASANLTRRASPIQRFHLRSDCRAGRTKPAEVAARCDSLVELKSARVRADDG